MHFSQFQPLTQDWFCARAAPDQACRPEDLPATLIWHPAPVPGTAAQVLRQAGAWDGKSPLDLDSADIWYRCPLHHTGLYDLRFEGLATFTEIWLDDTKISETANMFQPIVVQADLTGRNGLYLRFRALATALKGQRGRPRWRPRMINLASLRRARTSLLGHMPGWCPMVTPVGPWRPISLRPTPSSIDASSEPQLVSFQLHPSLDQDGTGHLEARIELSAPCTQDIVLCMGPHCVTLTPCWPDPTRLEGQLRIPNIAPWWPHTHGQPTLHHVHLRIGDHTIPLSKAGFRRLSLSHSADGRGFEISVNGVPIFCRGANWITPDLIALPDTPQAIQPILDLAQQAGMNMLRVSGVGVYESDAFYAACDRMGILVWQDAIFANFDYPTDELFLNSVQAEIDAFLTRTAGHACLTLLCGGSEIAQQAAMMGLPAQDRAHILFDQHLPGWVERLRPDIIYLPHTPGGSPLPFQTDQGVTHYYGVGAYQRPFEDIRRANVRFASECLAFSNVPEDVSLRDDLKSWHSIDPDWKHGVPRDAGVGWDFEDVRDHYTAHLFEVDIARLRYENPLRYLELSRACVTEAITAVFSEWRRVNAGCAGGLVWLLNDLRPGAGWGVIDSSHRPKSAWYALQRVFRPVHLGLTDEGLNGIGVHVMNDTAAPIDAVLELFCLTDGHQRIAQGHQHHTIPARGGASLNSAEILPTFFDITYAYRFGPPGHEITVARLKEASTGHILAEAFHLPRHAPHHLTRPEIQARLHRTPAPGIWQLDLRCTRFAQSVHMTDQHFQPTENWFHMAPDREYTVFLKGPGSLEPQGEILALNTPIATRYGS